MAPLRSHQVGEINLEKEVCFIRVRNGNELCWYGLLEWIAQGAEPEKKLLRNWHYTPGPGAPTKPGRRSCDREPEPNTVSRREAKVIPFDRTFFFGLRLGPVCAQQADTGEGRIGNNTWARKTFIGGLKTDRSPVQRMIGPLGRLPHELRRHHGGHEPQEREADAAVVPRSAAPPVVRFGSQHKEPGEPRAV